MTTAIRLEEPQFICDRCGEASFGGFTFGNERICRPCAGLTREPAAASNPTAGVECPECGTVALQPCAHSTPASDSGRGDSGIPHYKVITGRYKIYNGDGELIAGALTQHDAETIVKALRRANGWEATRDALRDLITAAQQLPQPATHDGLTLADALAKGRAALADLQQ